MGSPESDIRIPEPKDEFRKTRLGKMGGGINQDIGFTNFRLAQKLDENGKKLGRASYGVNLENKTGNEKQDELTIYLTQYISDMELGPVEVDDKGRFLFDRDPNPEKRKKILEKIINPCIMFLNKIEDKFKEFKNVQYFSIDKGVFSLGVIVPPRKDIQIININLSAVLTKSNRGEFLFDSRKMDQELQGRTKEDLSKLRESLETESLFGGSVVITYEQIDTAKRLTANALAITSGYDIANRILYRVAKFMYRDEAGKMQEIDPKIIRSMLNGIGDKTRIKSMIFPIMRKIGKVYNPIRSGFTDITTLALDRATDRVKSLKRTDIERGGTMTEAEFQAEKQRVIQEVSRMPKSEVMTRVGKIMKSIPSASLQGVIYGVFFADYQKHTYDTAQLYRGFAEAGLFEVGSHIGQRIAPGFWKMPASLIGGGLAIMGGHLAGGAMQLDKKVWRALPERMTGDGTKSFVGHAATGGVVNDTADKLDRDIGIPGTRGGAVLYNPLGPDGIMPNVDFSGTHITFGTDPRQYLQSRVGGTDTHWNKRIDEYVSWATMMTMKILQEYDNNRGYFVSSNGKKEELLRERLQHVFDSEDGANVRNRQIVDDCIDYVTTKLTKIKDLNSRKELLSIFLGNYGNILKIDKDSLNYDEKLLERDKTVIDGQKDMYLSHLKGENRRFAEKIFGRLAKGERLIDGKFVKHRGDMIGQDVEVFMRDESQYKMYQSLIDDPTGITQEWYDILGYKENEIDFKKGFKIPDSRVLIGGKNVYLSMMVQIMANEYALAFNKKDIKKITSLDGVYGMGITSELQKNPTLFQKNPFGGIIGQYFILERLIGVNPSVKKVLAQANQKPKPTQGDVFVYLLNTYTEYREQKRFIDTQKSIGYANKWKLL